MPYQLLADAVLALHFGVVVFVVGGLVAVLAGNWFGWRWVNGWRFRMLHLAAIAFIVIQTWLGQLSPLTLLESWLREQGGASGYSQSFVEHWLQRILFFDAPFWVFTLAYTLFGLLVVFTWWIYPPHGRRQ